MKYLPYKHHTQAYLQIHKRSEASARADPVSNDANYNLFVSHLHKQMSVYINNIRVTEKDVSPAHELLPRGRMYSQILLSHIGI